MNYELLVNGQHLREAARILKLRRKVRSSDKATVGFADGYAVISALERGFVARATGLWPGIAQTSAAVWFRYKNCPPPGKYKIISCSRISFLKSGCCTGLALKSIAQYPVETNQLNW